MGRRVSCIMAEAGRQDKTEPTSAAFWRPGHHPSWTIPSRPYPSWWAAPPPPAKPILDPNTSYDKHHPKSSQPEGESRVWYYAHPNSASGSVSVPDFRNYGHGPYHGRVGPYPYAVLPHAPATLGPCMGGADPVGYGLALEEGIEQGSRHNEAIDDMTKREQYLETMNKVTRMRNERLLEEYRDLPSYTHVHPHPRPRSPEHPEKTRFSEALMALREEQAEDRCRAIDRERDIVRAAMREYQSELQGYNDNRN